MFDWLKGTLSKMYVLRDAAANEMDEVKKQVELVTRFVFWTGKWSLSDFEMTCWSDESARMDL